MSKITWYVSNERKLGHRILVQADSYRLALGVLRSLGFSAKIHEAVVRKIEGIDLVKQFPLKDYYLKGEVYQYKDGFFLIKEDRYPIVRIYS